MLAKNSPRRPTAFLFMGLLSAIAMGACAAGNGGSSTNDETTEGSGAGSSWGGGGAGGAGSVDVATTGNPFVGAEMYVSQDYANEIDISIAAHPEDAALLEKVKQYPTAIWLDRIAAIDGVNGRQSLATHLDNALALQGTNKKPYVTLIVVYDLPNRDCAAKASSGELLIEQDGLNKYKTQYIDKIASIIKAHPNQRIVAVVEPDSLPNLATNMGVAKCAASASAYREGSAYAIKTLSEASANVFLYLDSAQSGWLGWPDNQQKMTTIFKEVLDAAGGVDKIRGFASNVSNYTVLDASKPPQDIFDYQSNPCHDELTFVAQISAAYASAGITNNHFLIDTGRNGVGGIRHDWGYWCNNIGAGLGERPRAEPGPAGVDAYVWVKPPGESDGTSDSSAARYDEFCGKEDAAKPAPEAGQWFDSYFVALAKNASPPL